jgi:hypothetical protein
MEQDLRLTQDHLRLHENLQEDDKRREVFYVSGSGPNRVLSVEIPPALYWFATTDGDDKYWRGQFCKCFGLVGGIEHLVKACEGRTIGGGELRTQKVRAYAAMPCASRWPIRLMPRAWCLAHSSAPSTPTFAAAHGSASYTAGCRPEA